VLIIFAKNAYKCQLIMHVPGSIEKLDDKLVKGRSIVLLLCDAFVHKGMAAQDCFMHKLKHPILTGSMHDLLCASCMRMSASKQSPLGWTKTSLSFRGHAHVSNTTSERDLT